MRIVAGTAGVGKGIERAYALWLGGPADMNFTGSPNDWWTPSWLGGETLYSLCARYHRVAGHCLASETSRRLFGHPRVGLSHDMAGCLGTFVRRTEGRLGDADTILSRRTVLAYYLPFLEAEARATTVSRLTDDGPRGLKARLGLLATRFGATHPLKACDACIVEDEGRHGIATWHLVHQLPAVWICPDHGRPLWAALTKVDGLRRFQWLLPDDIGRGQRRTIVEFDWPAAAVKAAVAIGRDTAALLAMPAGCCVDRGREASVLWRRLAEAGYASESGRLHLAPLSAAWDNHTSHYAPLPESAALCVTADAALASLRRVLSPRGQSTHPLRHLVVVQWLYGSWGRFMAAYKRRLDAPLSPRAKTQLRHGAPEDRSDGRKAVFVSLVLDEGLSLRAAGQQVGVSMNTALQWASASGLPVRRRPKRVDELRRAGVEAALRRGASKSDIAQQYGVSIETVTRILLTHPNVGAERTQRQFDRRQRVARKHLEAAAERHPEWGITRLRACYPADFAWLGRHDRQWFDQWKPGLPVNKAARRGRVDWDERDRALEREVKLTLRHSQPDRTLPWSMSELLRAVPVLKTKSRKLDRMPRTRAILEAALASAVDSER